MSTKGPDGCMRLDAPVRAIKVADVYDSDVPGAYQFEPNEPPGNVWGTINFVCPCGCGKYMRLQVGLGSKPIEGARPTWKWDGNGEEPTLEPSIHNLGHWHGFLTKGYFRDA